MALSIDHQEHADCTVLVLRGDLDLSTAPQLTTAALAAIESGRRHVVLDAYELDFCDSSGLTSFVRIAGQLEPLGRGLAIAGAQPIVRRVLELSGLDEALVVSGTVEEAVSRLTAEPVEQP